MQKLRGNGQIQNSAFCGKLWSRSTIISKLDIFVIMRQVWHRQTNKEDS